MAEDRPLKRQRFNSKIITIKVGNDSAEDFFIHEKTLTKNSHFFKAALNKKWKEGQSRVIELPEDEADVFSQYAEWLYFGPLDSSSLEPELSEEDFLDQSCEWDALLVSAYIFGEKILDAKFCNAIICALLINTQHGAPGVGSVNALYLGTEDTSPVRRFLVDIWASKSHANQSFTINEAEEKIMHPRFAADLLRAFMNLPNGMKPISSSSKPRQSWLKAE